jgi:hypothetical protein
VATLGAGTPDLGGSGPLLLSVGGGSIGVGEEVLALRGGQVPC